MLPDGAFPTRNADVQETCGTASKAAAGGHLTAPWVTPDTAGFP